MNGFRSRSFLISLFTISLFVCGVTSADCTTATVGSPFSDWQDCSPFFDRPAITQTSRSFDIWTNAGLTQAQFLADNPGINCSLLQIGQKVCISTGTLPSNAPKPSPNGTCAEYTTVPQDSCSAIALKFDITIAQIETFNANTFHWKGCAALQAQFTMCVSSGQPPPIPIIPGLQCGPQSAGNATCPLKACCSAFGFCGLTEEFCTTSQPNPCLSNCFTPTLPTCSAPASPRSIAYYGGFGDRRACSTNIAPSQVDWSPYTHAHFAFATISQTLQIQLEDADAPLLQQLLDAKTDNHGLKVIIAVGGWDFSESDPTRDLFSLMISSSSSRATFISSVVAFLSKFSLDGIDIDFEYPSAIERNAAPTDTPNLTSFFTELRAALPTKIISCATPAGYWFLKGFEIDKIATSVTYLNMMSYDYHGQWDTNVTDQAPVTNPHTSIEDIRDSALLYTRAGIDLSKVNLGLALYARTYKLSDSSCVGYNCTMIGGGAPGVCTATPGILAQFEVLSLLNQGITPTLDGPTETYWFDNQGSLVTFDQQDTRNVKKKFANSACFGGTFIWSLDQATSDFLAGDGSGSGSGPNGAQQFTAITWSKYPNPFPSPGAVSETFAQPAGVVTSTFSTVLGASTKTVTSVITLAAQTQTTTSFVQVSGTFTSTLGTTVIPAVTSTVTRTVTSGATVITSAVITNKASTVVIAIPTSTTTIIIGAVTITLNSGGTPVVSPVPTFITQSNAVTPTWTFNILPPPSATAVTFTAPLTSTPTWSSTVPVPTKSDSPAQTVIGPPGDHNRCDSGNLFTLLFHAILGGCPPLDVGVRGGITPTPIKPPDWTGPWTDPLPLPTGPPGPGNDPDPTNNPTSTGSQSSSSSTTSTATCGIQTPVYNLPDDAENSDTDSLGTDPDTLRKRRNTALVSSVKSQVVARVGRHIAVNKCNLQVASPNLVRLGAGQYLTVDRDAPISTNLQQVNVGGRPNDFIAQEHVFELGYINQLFTSSTLSTLSCTWVDDNFFSYTRADGSNLASAVLAVIDNVNNMVWVDVPMNQAKSNVVNQNRGSASNPPQSENMQIIGDFSQDEELIFNVEFFLRNAAALGQYFGATAGAFQATALAVQNLLSEITPNAVPDNANSIPAIFNAWLSNLIAGYPAGCTSRATNAYNFYRQQMQRVALTRNPPTVPPCFELFTANIFNPSGFNSQALIPPAPTSPHCNVPGTTGNVGFLTGSGPVNPVPFLSPQRVLGSGNTNFYALGSGNTISGSHWVAFDAATANLPSTCNPGVVVVNDAVPGQGLVTRTLNVAFQCNGANGKQTANFNFVLNGQGLGCAAFQTGHAGGTTLTILCAVAQRDAVDCANAIQNGAGAIQMVFSPT